jgi:hypothetical protein
MPNGVSLRDAEERVREYHRQYGRPVADAPRLLPTDGLKAGHLSVGLIDLWTAIRNMPSVQKALIPTSAREDLLVRFALRELELLGEWIRAHLRGDLEGAGFAWGDRLYLLLREAVAAGLPVEQLFTLTHEVTASEPPEEGEDGPGQARPAP